MKAKIKFGFEKKSGTAKAVMFRKIQTTVPTGVYFVLALPQLTFWSLIFPWQWLEEKNSKG